MLALEATEAVAPVVLMLQAAASAAPTSVTATASQQSHQMAEGVRRVLLLVDRRLGREVWTAKSAEAVELMRIAVQVTKMCMLVY